MCMCKDTVPTPSCDGWQSLINTTEKRTVPSSLTFTFTSQGCPTLLYLLDVLCVLLLTSFGAYVGPIVVSAATVGIHHGDEQQARSTASRWASQRNWWRHAWFGTCGKNEFRAWANASGFQWANLGKRIQGGQMHVFPPGIGGRVERNWKSFEKTPRRQLLTENLPAIMDEMRNSKHSSIITCVPQPTFWWISKTFYVVRHVAWCIGPLSSFSSLHRHQIMQYRPCYRTISFRYDP